VDGRREFFGWQLTTSQLTICLLQMDNFDGCAVRREDHGRVLAALGVGGIVAFSVSSRTRACPAPEVFNPPRLAPV